MSDNLLIRGVRGSDFTEWKPLWDAYNAFYGRTGDTALPDEITARTWSRFFDPYEPMHALVAERSGRLLGLTHLIFHRSTISLGSVCYLQDLFTSASARGEGIGRSLVEEIYRYAEVPGVSTEWGPAVLSAALKGCGKSRKPLQKYPPGLKPRILLRNV